MTRKALIAGLTTGLLLSLGLLYPTFYFFVSRINPLWFDADVRLAAAAPGLVLSAVVALAALAMMGVWPAVRSGATSWSEGARAGTLGGVVAALMVFVIVVMPVNAWLATIPLLNFVPSAGTPVPPEPFLSEFVQRVAVSNYARDLPGVLIAGAIIGWLLGGLTGFLRRDQRHEPLTLLDAIEIRKGRRRWFARNDAATRAGLLAGLICGGLIALTSLADTSNALNLNLALDGGVANALSPVAALALFAFGALAIIFIQDPPRWYISRWSAATLAGLVTGALVYLALSRTLLIMIGLGRYPGFSGLSPGHQATIARIVNEPALIVAAYFLLPLVVGFSIVLSVTLWGALQGLIFGLLLPPIFRRSIDRALSIRSRLREDPAQVLPQLYAIYNRHSDAVAILPHLAFSLNKKQLPQARVIAAHHLLNTQPDRAAEAIEVIATTLETQPEWRWHDELGALYRVMREGLRVSTTSQLAVIEPLPDVQTTTLPLMLSRACTLLTQVLVELRKVERVDDLSSKTIFLNNTLEAIRIGRRHAEAMRQGWISIRSRQSDPGESFRQVWEGDPSIREIRQRLEKIKEPEDFKNAMRAVRQVRWGQNLRETFRLADELRRNAADRQAWVHTAYPEAHVFDRMLDQWEGLVLQAVKELQGRAAVVSELKTRRLNYAASVPLLLSIRNDGFNIAESVRLIVNDGEGYRVTAGAQQTIEILTAKAEREVEVTIEPQASDRVRLSWRVQYYDAVDKDRTVEFADVIEFIGGQQAARPFVRIFPIPYVTGMPLKTDQLFVGRTDVFDYIQEHLFGVYQNNVIVLHGQRRTGKTSILYRLKKVLAATHIAVLVDMQGKAARGTLDFLYSLADDIVYALEDQGVTVELPPRSDFAESPEFFFRSRFLRGVYEALPRIAAADGGLSRVASSAVPGAESLADNSLEKSVKKHLLLMFDEFEELQKRVEDGKLEAGIFPFLRNLMQHEELLDFVFAGTHKLEELGAEYWSILFNIASYKKISFLSHDDAGRLISEPVRPNLEYDPLAIERIISVTGGHPYFTQVVCHELVSYHNETQRSYLTANDVEAVLDRIMERGEAHFKFIWAESSAAEHKVLLALADLLETAETASVDEVQAQVDKRAIDLDGARVLDVFDQLEMSDVLTRSSPRSNLYRFKIDLIRRWICATQPL